MTGPSPRLPEKERTNSLGMTLVRIEPGSFMMGSNWQDKEKPPHEIKITKDFFLSAHQVTQGQYQEVVGKTPSHFKGSDDLPVEQVSWFDAVEFCNRLSTREKRGQCYQINGTEVELVSGSGPAARWPGACY
jgi:sulfatase modifying factor 1